MAGFLSKLLTLGEGKQLKHYEATAAKINGLESEMLARSDQELRALTAAFRERAQNGEDLQSLLPEAFAAVREAYTGPDADWSRPCYSPLFADLRGLPPTLVQVGTNEILKSDSERLVENLQKAGVYAQLEVYPECWHVFQQMPIRRAAVAMESAGRFVQRII